ncbi:Hint domain-containing protein [Paracoccus isoporae]|uniref:Hint domain-containing protein n=1 Tax=Paracoccus isoporae TaxID=591205 RepID=A0A1G6XAZ7_9RHOB|nr:Hint domain-containing protein [Paracoccus isoporae]SDD74455.1 Hint domain-containing protein [Paracoccus isoporae]
MADYAFGGLINAPGVFTWVSGGTDPGSTIDEVGDGLPEAYKDQVYIYNGGSKNAVVVTDDDDGFVEADGRQQQLAQPATINGTPYTTGAKITTTGMIVFNDPETNTQYTVFTGAAGTNSSGVASPTDFYIWQGGKEPPPGTSLTVLSRQQPNRILYSSLPAPCFCNGTLIETPEGQCPVEELTTGDLVITASGRPIPILWIGSREVGPDDLRNLPKLRPVVISAGSLGSGTPAADLTLSPQHRVRIASAITHELTGTDEVLVPASKLIGVPGVSLRDSDEPFTYYHLLLEAHSCVLSNGAWTESLYLGKEFLGSLSAEGRAELAMIFPELFGPEFHYPPAAPIMSRRKHVDRLIAHHLRESATLT